MKSRRDRLSRQQRAAWVAGGCAIAAAAITGGLGLFGSGNSRGSSSPSIRASGGSASNTNTCIGGGAYVQGTVNCQPSNPSVTQLVHFSTTIQHEAGSNWIVPEPAGEPPPSGECTEADIARRVAWFEKQNGVEAQLLRIKVQVVNDSDETLVFQRLGLASYEHRPRVSGKSYIACAPEGGPVEGEHVEMNLHDIPPTFEFQDDAYKPTTPFAFSPTHGEPAVFYIQASTLDEGRQNGYDYRWTLGLAYTLGGHSDTYRITDRGKPFDLTDSL